MKNPIWKRSWHGALLLAGLGGAWWLVQALGLQDHLTLDALKASQTAWQTQAATDPWRSAGLFLAVYVAVTALSIPGATLLTLAAGAVFGLGLGTVLVSVASVLGATLAMLSARYLLRDLVRRRWGAHLNRFDQRLAEHDAETLFSLRLLPVMPFFVLNLLMGLTAMPARRFAWVSQIGMLPATLAYVNAGTQLGQIDSVADVLSPTLWLSMALLAALPWLTKAVWHRASANLEARRALKPWLARKPRHFDRNLVVIGAGAAGLVTSYIAAAAKAKVTLIEAHRMGGDCLYTGCVPSKALIASARVAHQVRTAAEWGIGGGVGGDVQGGVNGGGQESLRERLPSGIQDSAAGSATDGPRDEVAITVDFAQVMKRVRRVIADVAPHDSAERYQGLGVDVRQGRARLIDPWTVAITGANGLEERLTTRGIVLATGAEPRLPKLPGLDQVSHVTSDTLWDDLSQRTEAPPRVVVLGGGPIGCELAQALSRLGSRVTIVQRGGQLLPREDADVGDFLARHFQSEGIQVLLNAEALRCERDGSQQALVVAGGGPHWAAASASASDPDAGAGAAPTSAPSGAREYRLPFDLLLIAIGRQPRLTGFGLEALGIDTSKAWGVNESLQTRFPHILAAGDVAGRDQFTHVAAHQAWTAAINALFGDLWRTRVDTRVVPRVTFTDPEIARVGLNASEAKAQGLTVEHHRYELDDLDRAITEGRTEGWVEVLTPPGRDRILGVTIVAPHAGDMLPEFVIAMKHGLGLSRLLATIHAYPTWAEANKAVASRWKQAHLPEHLLRGVAWFQGWRRH